MGASAEVVSKKTNKKKHLRVTRQMCEERDILQYSVFWVFGSRTADSSTQLSFLSFFFLPLSAFFRLDRAPKIRSR